MQILFIYLVGCLLGFGIVTSLINSKIYEEAGMPTEGLVFYGTVCSWLTVLFFIWGLLRALWQEADDDS
jgi:hypothetical protein